MVDEVLAACGEFGTGYTAGRLGARAVLLMNEK